MFSALWFCNRRFGACSGTRAPQYLLQALHSGDLIPILSLESGSEDDFLSAWTSGDFVFLLPDQAFGSFLRLSVSTCLCDCGLGLFPGKLSQRHLREPRCWSCSQAFASTKRIPGQVSLPTQVHKWWVVDGVGFEEQEAGPPLSFMQIMLMHSNYSVATIPFQ